MEYLKRIIYYCGVSTMSIIISVALPFHVIASTFDYQLYARILNKYVYEGKTIKRIKLNVVDYEGLYKESQNPSSDYSLYLKQLSQFNPDDLSSRSDQMAFWINGYNIGAIKMILGHYPVNSIRSMKISFFKNPWKKEILNINGRLYSLHEIEHEILLGKYKEKMAHFGIVCASLSCPDISKEVYKGENLMSQLERQAKTFLNSPQKGIFINRLENTVYVSKIFKFDSRNFSRGIEDIMPFILPFVGNEEDKEYLKSKKYQLDFLGYDWGLNNLKTAI